MERQIIILLGLILCLIGSILIFRARKLVSNFLDKNKEKNKKENKNEKENENENNNKSKNKNKVVYSLKFVGFFVCVIGLAIIYFLNFHN